MAQFKQPTLRFLGAAGTVTGSRYLVEAGQRRILVDCGLFQGFKQLRRRNRKPFPVRPSMIDTVLLTHRTTRRSLGIQSQAPMYCCWHARSFARSCGHSKADPVARARETHTHFI